MAVPLACRFLPAPSLRHDGLTLRAADHAGQQSLALPSAARVALRVAQVAHQGPEHALGDDRRSRTALARPSGLLEVHAAAGEITEGADLARKRRISARNDKELAKGPARLATALDVDRAL
jgi:hypothetical protein